MERFFYKTKRIVAILLAVLALGIIMTPTSEAAYTSNMKKGDKYKYTGTLLIVYKDKQAAKYSNIFRRSRTLTAGAEITIEEINGNIVKIGDNQYIKCTLANIKKISKISDRVTETKKEPISETTPTPEKIAVTKIALNKKEGKLNVGASLELKATVEPSNATNKTVTWTTSNKKVATVSNGKIKAVSGGTAIITATADGKSTTFNLAVELPVTKISLDKTNGKLNVGKTLELKVTITPNNATNKTITWTTSNKKVATVSNGKIKAVGAGTAKITATADGKSATFNLTVEVPVEKVTLNKTKCTLSVGETLTLKPTITPSNATNKTVTWKTSNKKIATVSNGKIKAVGAGTATITVTVNKKTATCKVEVKQPVSSIDLGKAKAELYKGETLTLKPTVKPNNATNKTLTWTTSNKNVAAVSNGKITAKGVGTAIITATAKDGSGKKAVCKITVKDPYEYNFRNKTYKIAVTKDRLDSVLKTIANKGIYQNNGWRSGGSYSDLSCTNSKCYRIALCHLDMLLDENVEKNVVHSGYNKGSYSSYYQNMSYNRYTWNAGNEVKKQIDAGKPVSIHTYTSYGQHWVAAVGYKGNGSSMNDLLFISCTNGVLCLNNEIDVKGLHAEKNFVTLNKNKK